MFEPINNISLYDSHQIDFDDLDWSLNEFEIPLAEFMLSPAEPIDFDHDEPLSPQSQIRNHDCMWSGRCTTHPNECLSVRSSCNKSSASSTTGEVETKKHASAIDKSQIAQSNGQQHQRKQHQQTIPPGRSLLRLNHAKQNVIKVPNMSTNDFLREREFIARPDTPLSLDDEPPQFKHSIDLAACTMGSNKMSLINESQTEIINILKEHLEDVNSNQSQIRTKLSTYLPRFNKSETIDELFKDMQAFSDYEIDDEDEDEEEHANESDSFDSGNVSAIMSSQSSSNSSSASSHSSTTYENMQSMHSDHSYTRSKSRVDVIGLGVQTPSDSGKYITKTINQYFCSNFSISYFDYALVFRHIRSNFDRW